MVRQVYDSLSNSDGGNQILITTGKEAYSFDADANTIQRLAEYARQTQIDAWNAAWDNRAYHATFDEWDRKYQK